MTRYDIDQKLIVLFDSQIAFEKEVLMVKNEQDREEVMDIIAHKLVYDTLKHSLHFFNIHSKEDLDTSQIEKKIAFIIIEELLVYLHEVLKLSKIESGTIVKNMETIRFINALSSFYYRRYHHLIFFLSADTLFDKIDSVETPSRFLKECIEGSLITPSLTQLPDGTKIFYSYSQAYKKIHSVVMIKKNQIKKLQLDVAKLMQDQEDMDENTLAQRRKMFIKKREALEELQEKTLDTFDANLKKVKMAINVSLFNMA